MIDDEVLGHIEALNHLAPLHNPVNVTGIKEARRIFPAVPHVAVFDTAFHSTLPSYAYLYGLPYEYYEKKGVRRYGFHGSSHSYVCLKAAQHLQKRVNELEIVSCHLGNGASLCAVDHELENPVLIANGSPSGREDGASGVPPSTSKLRFVK